jgi:hypothetical protein
MAAPDFSSPRGGEKSALRNSRFHFVNPVNPV